MKKINRRSFLKCMATAAAAAGLAGCGAAGAADAPASSASSAAAASGEAAASSQADEPLSCALTVWSTSEDQDEACGSWLQSSCEAFSALHPNWDITFNYGVCTESDAKKVIPQDVDAAADVYVFESSGTENLIQANAIAEFGGSFADEIRANYPDQLVSAVTYEDGIYGVPFTSNTWYMYYDKSVFSDEDITSLDKMLEKGTVAISLEEGWYIASFFAAMGCTFFGEDGHDRESGIDVSGDKAVAAANYMIDLVQNDHFVVAKPSDAISMMREGRVNAYMCGSWQAKDTKELLGDNFGVAKAPCITVDGEEKQLKAFCSAKAVGVKATTEHPEVAIKLAMYLGGYDGQKAHYEKRNYVPCYSTLIEDAGILADPVVAAEVDVVENASVLKPAFVEMLNWNDSAKAFGEGVHNGDITHDNVEEKVDDLYASVNAKSVS